MSTKTTGNIQGTLVGYWPPNPDQMARDIEDLKVQLLEIKKIIANLDHRTAGMIRVGG